MQAIEMFLLNKFQGRHSGTVTPQQEACEMDSSSLLPLFSEMPVFSILYQTLETIRYSERNFESVNSGFFFFSFKSKSKHTSVSF